MEITDEIRDMCPDLDESKTLVCVVSFAPEGTEKNSDLWHGHTPIYLENSYDMSKDKENCEKWYK